MTEPLVVNEIANDKDFGSEIGLVKWFSRAHGYGFITVQTNTHRGKDIFVHHSGIHPLNSNFRTLRKGEYVALNVIEGQKGFQAVDVTGIMGGPLMCDNVINNASNQKFYEETHA